MSQLVLESENDQTLQLIQALAEKLNVNCQFVFQKNKLTANKQDESLVTLPIESAWEEEIIRRIEEIDSGKVVGLEFSQAMEQLNRRFAV
jgi:hypothetical protein